MIALEERVSLVAADVIEVRQYSNSLQFRRSEGDLWLPSRVCAEHADMYTFAPTREIRGSQKGLHDRGTWHIVEARVEYDYFWWIDRVVATSARRRVEVDLGESLQGSRAALVDFLRRYIDRVQFLNHDDI
ncbi:MAG: hypothetical protein ABIH41_03705 [Nanoarchaeota archaeon]